jgi:hypothetical protein
VATTRTRAASRCASSGPLALLCFCSAHLRRHSCRSKRLHHVQTAHCTHCTLYSGTAAMKRLLSSTSPPSWLQPWSDTDTTRRTSSVDDSGLTFESWDMRVQDMLYDHVLSIVGPENAPREDKPRSRFFTIQVLNLLKPSFLVQHVPALRARSHVGFVGLSEPYDTRQVGLNSCVGRWEGCIPADAPALVYHHGALSAC